MNSLHSVRLAGLAIAGSFLFNFPSFAQQSGTQFLTDNVLQDPVDIEATERLDTPIIEMSELLSRLEATETELSRLRNQMLSPQSGLPAAQSGGSADGGEADNGTNPATFKKRVVFYNEYYDVADSDFRGNITHFFLAWPIADGKAIFNIDVPIVNVDGLLGEASGLGDIRFRLIGKKVARCNKKLTWLAGTEFYVPSADSTLIPSATATPGLINFGSVTFGSDKYRFAPTVGAVYAPRKDIIFVPMLFQQFSFAGDEDAADINQTWLRLFSMKAFKTGTYLLPELQIIYDWEKDGQTDVYIAPEIGQVLGKDSTTVYVKPGAGLTGGATTRDWGIECGLRFAY